MSNDGGGGGGAMLGAGEQALSYWQYYPQQTVC